MRKIPLCSMLVCLSVIGIAQLANAEMLTRRSAFEYDPTSGMLVREIIEPDDSNLCLVTTYTYDAFGNRDSATTRNCNNVSSGGVSEALAPTGNAVFLSRTNYTEYLAGSTVIGGQSYAWSAGHFPTKN